MNKQSRSADNTSIGNQTSSLRGDEESVNMDPVPIEEQSKYANKLVPLYQLYRFADTTEDKVYVIIMIISSVLVGLANPINIYIYNNVVNVLVVPNANQNSTYVELLDKYVTQFGIVSIFTFIMGFAKIVCSALVSERHGRAMKLQFFTALLKQDIGWYDRQETGRLITQISDDIPTIQSAISDKLSQFLLELSKFLGNLVLAFSTSWKLSFVGLTAMPFVVIVFAIIFPLVSKYSRLQSEAYGSAGSIAQEYFNNIKTIMAFNAQKKLVDRFVLYLKLPEEYHLKKNICLSLAIGLVSFIIFACAGLVFYVGLVLFKNGTIDPGTVIIVIMSIVLGCISFGNAIPVWDNVIQAKTLAVPIFDILDRKPPISYDMNGAVPNDFIGNIVFSKVRFSYPTRPNVKILRGLTIRIPSGKTIAFVGPSGSGKSTIIQLIMRYYLPQSGEIILDGSHIEKLDLFWYRSHLALVQQEPNLFSWKICDNIRLGKLDASNDQIIQASILSSAYEFIKKTKDGFNTIIGERGAGFSGGQKQRIAIATAMIRLETSKILLLDEATSALDNISELHVQKAIDEATLRTRKTVVVVAHKLETIQNAHIIVVMKKGVIYELGNHKGLMRKRGLYFSMVEKQKGSKEVRDIKLSLAPQTSLETVSGQRESIMSTRNIGRMSRRFKSIKNLERRQTLKRDNVQSINYYESCYHEPTEIDKIMDFLYLLELSRSQMGYIIIGFIGSVILGLVFPGSSIIFAEIYEIFRQKFTDPPLFEYNRVLYSVLMLIPAVTLLIAQLFKDFGLSKAGGFLTTRLRKMFIESVLSQELGWLDQAENHSGVLSARLASEVSNSSEAMTLQLGVVVEAIANLLSAILISFYYNWQMSLLFFILIPLITFAGFMQAHSTSGGDSSSSTDLVKSGSFVTEALSNIKMIHSYNLHEHFSDLFEDILKTQFSGRKKRLFVMGFFGGIGQASFYFIYATIFFVGGIMMDNGSCSVQNLMRVFSCLTMCSTALSKCISLAPDISRSRLAARRTIETLTRTPLIDSTGDIGIVPEKKLSGRIEFKDVYFCYPTRPSLPILLNISFEHNAGESLGLVGQSGCGKSTILQLIQRFYDPSEIEVAPGVQLRGAVLMDGYNLRSLNLAWVRGQIGVVSQEANLFNMSVAENIILSSNSNKSLDYGRLYQAAKQADIHDFVMSLPDKYDTVLGEGGKQLSGGQRQRISIARALYKNPTILILDEATSALDTESEYQVTKSLKKLQSKYTTLQIAHRLKVIEDSNKILFLDAGVIVERGTHADLMKAGGYYFQLQQTHMGPVVMESN